MTSGNKTRRQVQSRNETCIVECVSTLDGDLCKSLCGENATLYEDYVDYVDIDENLDNHNEKKKSIIEAGKVYNSRLNVVVYSLMTGI